MVLNESYTLSNGVRIPGIALGTWQVSTEDAVKAVRTAIGMGYRHIDTAAAYRNETGVARGIRESGIPREEIFITTKVPAEIKSYEEAKALIAKSLENLGTGYIDLMLIHAPKPWSEMFRGVGKTYFEENRAVWRALEEAYRSGVLRAIGVSNFEISDIENLTLHEEVKPHVNQIRVHIGHTPSKVIAYCQAKDILVQAYSPNATGRLTGNGMIEEMARKYRVSVPQLANRYVLQLGTLPLPRSVNPLHIRENAALDFEISPEDMKILRNAGETEGL